MNTIANPQSSVRVLRNGERGNALILALIVMMLGVAVMLWVTQLSVENFRGTDRHVYQEDAFYAAQGAADAVAYDIYNAYKVAYGPNGDTPDSDDFRGWLDRERPAFRNTGNVMNTWLTFDVPEWAGKSFNAATVNRVRVSRRDEGTPSKGYSIVMKIEVEAAPTNSTDPNEFVTVTRLFNASNKHKPDVEYAMLTKNISCTVCHLRVSTLEFAKQVEGESPGEKYKRALVATTQYMNARFDSANSEIHGTFYIKSGARVENHGQAADLTAALNNGQFRMAALEKPLAPDEDGVSRSTFTRKFLGVNPTNDPVLNTNLQDSSDPFVAGENLYLKYSGKGDYNLDDEFPSPFPDTGDTNGIGANNRLIDPIELASEKADATGTITATFVTRVAPNTKENYVAKTYTYNDPKLPSTASPGAEQQITNEAGNLILIGTKDNPIKINGQVVIEGDVVIKGFVQGTGLIKATGNIYIPSDVQYLNPIDPVTNKEVFATSNRVGYAAGGNIVIGDYISKVTGSGSNYDNGRVDTGGPDKILDADGNVTGTQDTYANYVAEQLSISNRDELAKTMLKVPAGGGSPTNANSYQVDNPSYDPNYTPRFYTMYPDSEPYAFIKRWGGAAKYSTTTKSWETDEAPTHYKSHQVSINDVPATVRDTTKTPRLISVHPNWISPENMIRLIASEESTRLNDIDRNGKAFRIDGLLYTNNAIFSMQRWMSQTQDSNGSWQRPTSSFRGQMEINGSVIAPDLGVLVAGGHHGVKHAFRVNYDSRLKSLISGSEPGKWKHSVDGLARFSGPMAP